MFRLTARCISSTGKSVSRQRLCVLRSLGTATPRYFSPRVGCRVASGALGLSAVGAVAFATSSLVFASSDSSPSVVFVLGGPGAGKGTQCSLLVEEYGFVHLSAGDLLREAVRSGSEKGEMIKKMMAEGAIVPAEVTVGLLRDAMNNHPGKKFLIDGFPRNKSNVECWEKEMPNAKVEFVLFYDCPEEVMLPRLLQRGESSGRVDDNIASIKKRFRTFRHDTMPVIQYFETMGKVRQIISDDTVEKVFTRTQQAVKPIL